MSKDLPYFRFTVTEWLNDDISMENYHLQGIFICVCAFYWFQDCSITEAKLKKRFSDAQDEIDQLVEIGIIKETEDDFVQIKFLDKQYDILSEKRKKRVEAGRKGGLARASNAKATLKQSSSYKENNKDNEKGVKSKIPSLSEVREYFEENGYDPQVGENAWNFYQESINGTRKKYWRDSKGNPVRNWKMKMRSVWFKSENKKSSNDIIDGGTW